MYKRLIYTLVFLLSVSFCGFAQSGIVKDFKPVCDTLSLRLLERTGVKGELKLKQVMKRGSALDFYFDLSLSDYPLRDSDYKWFRTSLKELFPSGYSRYSLGEVYTSGDKMSELIVSDISSSGAPIRVKYTKKPPQTNCIVTALERPVFDKGLSGRQLAIWPSHGMYFDQSADGWQWQRPVMFQTVEDLLSTSFVLPYLVPMLENAGAYVMLPRERDTGVVEMIIDNDPCGSDRGNGTYSETGSWKSAGTGFADSRQVYVLEENPFEEGTARQASCSDKISATAVWTPDVPARGLYAVYVSYKSLSGSTKSAHYTVYHLGGASSFSVNQTMGGGTWIYLGTFEFDKGTDGRVVLDNVPLDGSANGVVTADAVKIGGGMGNIARALKNVEDSDAETSGMPRYAEAARYWLQWAGIDPKVYSQYEFKNDYRDDLYSRGDWVDYMSGGTSINPKVKGKGVHFDATLAFHTDAGTFPNDSIVGSLVIYTKVNEKKTTLPDGSNRGTMREFANIVQTQIVSDLQGSVAPQWQRRQIWNRGYRESRTPPTPAILTESLSHQNFADMRYALDPTFKFTLSRAIYKGILKYLSSRYQCDYVVQPLPVTSFAAVLKDTNTASLSWMPRVDSLELTAVPDGYMLYTRVDDGGFDTGVKVSVSDAGNGRVGTEVNITPGHIYSYKVTALNNGGESFPSEVLALGIPITLVSSTGGQNGGKAGVLIVNNFTRVSAPAWYDGSDYGGFLTSTDSGVPYIRDIAFTGEMYENRRGAEYYSNSNPGFGASHNYYSGRTLAGNTFDFVYLHGKAVMQNGLPFCSMSADAFAQLQGSVSPSAVDIICGKQVTTLTSPSSAPRYTVFPTDFQNAITSCARSGVNILISGSYIATDVWDGIYPREIDGKSREQTIRFVQDVLGYKWAGNNSSDMNTVKAMKVKTLKANEKGVPQVGKKFVSSVATAQFNKDFCEEIYRVESPDGLLPAGRGASTIFKYSDTNISAGVSYTASDGHRAVCFGFPLETVTSEEEFNSIIASAVKFFGL